MNVTMQSTMETTPTEAIADAHVGVDDAGSSGPASPAMNG